MRITRAYRPVDGSTPADTVSSHEPGERSRIVPIVPTFRGKFAAMAVEDRSTVEGQVL
ncbi:MAG TPA: hypothetical protein VFP03_08305 [Jiangellaceae bacterium]|nr:hypothetical protein [Jiangellaceae bacterium]